MQEYKNSDELYHYGIPGMKWGIRRFQNKNGSLTNIGKKRYNNNQKTNDTPEKSKHRLKLESKYKELGLNEKQAEQAAAKRIKTEKILATMAGVTLAACAAYVIKKKLDERVDGIIESGAKLQRIEGVDGDGKIYDIIYASKGKHDNERYKGMLGYLRADKTGKAKLLELESTKNIKIASQKNARSIFEKLWKDDSEFRDEASKYIYDEKRHFLKNKMTDGNYKDMYERFNTSITAHKIDNSSAFTKFFNKLKDNGYGAIQDINDMKYSGYEAKNPLIIFDNASKNVKVKNIIDLGGKEELRNLDTKEWFKAEGDRLVKENFVKTTGTLSGVLASSAVVYHVSDPKIKKK